ncbi:MAG TPA: hypothetical protein VJC16_06330 [Candidatus Nanoarchaeia archaeon]|nr:hypothetical protein [Candidatus Nanoarchaeia archaeon]
MPAIDVFHVLAQYHAQQNLPAWLQYAKADGGRIVPRPETGHVFEEGLDENTYTHGFLVAENGDTLVNRLFEDKFIVDGAPPEWEQLSDDAHLLAYLPQKMPQNGERRQNRESSYALNSNINKIARVREFANSAHLQPTRSLSYLFHAALGILHIDRSSRSRITSFADYLPQDFLTQGRYTDVDNLETGIGTKTRNAIRISVHYSKELAPQVVRTYQIKATPFSNAGMGVVAQFGPDGLERTMHFEHRPGEHLPYVHDLFQVAAIERQFGRDTAGRKVCTASAVVDPAYLRPASPHVQEPVLLP